MVGKKKPLFIDETISLETPIALLTEASVYQYAEVLVYVHGGSAPYFALMNALARRESSKAGDWSLWLAVSIATSQILAEGSSKHLH